MIRAQHSKPQRGKKKPVVKITDIQSRIKMSEGKFSVFGFEIHLKILICDMVDLAPNE